MNRLISILLLAFLSVSAFSQDLTVRSFQEMLSDLSAKTNPRKDANDIPCALVKVQIALPDVHFEGNVIGNVERKVNEYWVYMSKGSKHLKVHHPDYLTCNIKFADYGINSLEEKTTYELVIVRPERTVNNTQTQEVAQKQVQTAAQEKVPEAAHNKVHTEEVQQEQVPAVEPVQITQSQDARAVDLGLSVKWASCNIGATRPEDYGEYFAWGETEPKQSYKWSNYKWNNSNNTQNKYSTAKSFDGNVALDIEDDAAHVNWGGSWRMPTSAELTELRKKCKWTWTFQNDVPGYQVTGPNGNSIFLPATGYYNNTNHCFPSSHRFFWSTSFVTPRAYYAYRLYYGSSTVDKYYGSRYYGRSVRAVCP